MAGGRDDVRHGDVGICRVGVGEGLLCLRLELVVEFLRHPGAQLVKQRPHLQARHQHGEQPRHPAELSEVAEQGIAGARVLDLHGHPAAVLPDGAVDLADRRGGGRLVIELDELVAPVRAQVLGQHPVHGAGGQRRRGFLELGQRRPVRPREFRGQRGLEDGQRLAELHRAALELPQDPEDLVGRPLLDLGGDQFGGAPADALAEPQRGPAGQPNGEGRQFGCAGESTPGEIAHNIHCPSACKMSATTRHG